ncbi:hypothetical protein [Nakamurella endophytica]|nr:hypothetical protein [Nakamurella endophytica]
MSSDRRSIGPLSHEVRDRGTWSRERPPGHSRICWAAALGRARHAAPLAPEAAVPAEAGRILAADPAACLCGRQAGHTRGRRQRA